MVRTCSRIRSTVLGCICTPPVSPPLLHAGIAVKGRSSDGKSTPESDADRRAAAEKHPGRTPFRQSGAVRAPHALAAFFFLAGCSDLPALPDGDFVTPDAGVADAPGSDVALPPSPANLGWIGGACTGPAACEVPDGFCLTDGFPN